MKRAFSLIEVLIAATILGLGTLALIAVLAAGASQQQISSRQNLSVGVGRNSEALLAHSFGRMVARSSGAALQQGVWYPVFQDEDTYFLSVAPFFFLVDGPEQEVELWKNTRPLTDPNSGWGVATYNSAAPVVPFRSNSSAADTVQRLPHRRVHPIGFSVTVEYLQRNPTIRRSRTFSMLNPFTPPDVSFSTPQPLVNLATGDILRFDFKEFSRSESDSARVESFTLTGLTTDHRIERITVAPYRWRNDDLVSLNNRLVYEPDAGFPTGRRPVMGYTTLYRVLGSNAQLAFLTYGLTPLARPDSRLAVEGFPFIPPESADDFNANVGLLRSVELELGYDPETEEYYFEIPITEEDLKGWAFQSGQVLLVQRAAPTRPNPMGFGADFPVRVVSVRQIGVGSGRVIRAVLDRSPRVAGRTPIEDLTSASTIPVQVLALQSSVTSLTGDRSEWRIRPIEARIIQVEEE